jgi:hypothetical protein
VIGVVVYLTVVVAYSALLCGHQGEDWPPGWAWRRMRARRGRERHGEPLNPGTPRTRPPKRSINFLNTRKDPS